MRKDSTREGRKVIPTLVPLEAKWNEWVECQDIAMLWFSNQDASTKNVLKALVQCPFKVSPCADTRPGQSHRSTPAQGYVKVTNTTIHQYFGFRSQEKSCVTSPQIPHKSCIQSCTQSMIHYGFLFTCWSKSHIKYSAEARSTIWTSRKHSRLIFCGALRSVSEAVGPCGESWRVTPNPFETSGVTSNHVSIVQSWLAFGLLLYGYMSHPSTWYSGRLILSNSRPHGAFRGW